MWIWRCCSTVRIVAVEGQVVDLERVGPGVVADLAVLEGIAVAVLRPAVGAEVLDLVPLDGARGRGCGGRGRQRADAALHRRRGSATAGARQGIAAAG